MNSGETLWQFAAGETSKLLTRLVFQVHQAAVRHDPDSIHDLRVSIRRFLEALRVFARLLPKSKVRSIRKRLKRILDAAAETRDRDIALVLLAEAGAPPESPIFVALSAERKAAERRLLSEIALLDRLDYSAGWRRALNLVKP
jgi:CHAD domain-containing protein